MNYNILLSHGIPPEDCLQIQYLDNDNEILIFAKIKPSQRKCIFCNYSMTRIKEYKERKFKSLPTGNQFTIISLYLPRYICPNCNKTYTHNIETIANKSITKSLKNKLLEKFSSVCTFKSIAKEYDLTVTEVINIFDEHCPDLKTKFSEAICID